MSRKEYISRAAGKNDSDFSENPIIIETIGKEKGIPGENSKGKKGPSTSMKIEFGISEQMKAAKVGNCIGYRDDNGRVRYEIKESSRDEETRN